jgi:hypothetical protein
MSVRVTSALRGGVAPLPALTATFPASSPGRRASIRS